MMKDLSTKNVGVAVDPANNKEKTRAQTFILTLYSPKRNLLKIFIIYSLPFQIFLGLSLKLLEHPRRNIQTLSVIVHRSIINIYHKLCNSIIIKLLKIRINNHL